MKLSLITSSLVALSAAAPAFEDRRTHPAGLRSPLNIVKKAVQLEPSVVSPVVAARQDSHGGPILGEEVEAEEATLEARFTTGGRGGPVRAGSNSGGRYKREEAEVEEATLEARFTTGGRGGPVRAGSNSGGRSKRDMEARDNHNNFRPGNQGGNHGGNHGGNPGSNFNQPQKQPHFNHGGNHGGNPNFNFNFNQGGNHGGNHRGNPNFNNFNNFNQGGNHGGNPGFNFNQRQTQPQFNSNNNPLQIGEAKILINGGQEFIVPYGQLTLASLNSPLIQSLSTNQGGCVPVSVAGNGIPGSAIVQAVFSAGNNWQAGNGINPIQANNQIFFWCGADTQQLNILASVPNF